jgi:hypothetical protein
MTLLPGSLTTPRQYRKASCRHCPERYITASTGRLSATRPRTLDLQLSGHTHKGQIFPFSLVTKLYYPVDAGLKELADGSHLYVSRGAGTWGPPIRFLSPPEVTVIDLISDNTQS